MLFNQCNSCFTNNVLRLLTRNISLENTNFAELTSLETFPFTRGVCHSAVFLIRCRNLAYYHIKLAEIFYIVNKKRESATCQTRVSFLCDAERNRFSRFVAVYYRSHVICTKCASEL